MIKKYFTRKFRTLRGIRFAIFLKRYYDRIRLKIEGKTILQQEYAIHSNYIFGPNKGKRYYTIFNQIWTKEMVDDLKNHINQEVDKNIENEKWFSEKKKREISKVIVPNLKFDSNEFELEGEIVDNVKQKCLDGSIFEYYLVKTKYGINKYIKEEVKPKQK